MFNIVPNESIDFGYSLYILTYKNKYYELDKEQEFIKDDAIEKAIESLEQQINLVSFKEITMFIKKYYIQAYLTMLSNLHPTWSEETLIAYIHKLDGSTFYREYTSIILHCDDPYDELEIKNRIDLSNRNSGVSNFPSLTTFRYLRRHCDKVKKQLVELLEYYLPIYNTVKSAVKTVANKNLKLFHDAIHNRDEFFYHFEMLDQSLFSEKIPLVCYISVFMDSSIFISPYEDTDYMSLGSGLTICLTEAYQNKMRLRFFKCLSDPTKKEILSLFSKEILCAGDLVERLGLSKSTISHHISQLLASNLIKLHKKSGKKIYYVVNTKKMATIFDETLKAYQQ